MHRRATERETPRPDELARGVVRVDFVEVGVIRRHEDMFDARVVQVVAGMAAPDATLEADVVVVLQVQALLAADRATEL